MAEPPVHDLAVDPAELAVLRPEREAPTGPPVIVVDDVSKRFRLYREKSSSLKETVTKRRFARYEEFWALRGVSLEIPGGSTYGLIGHNGSGKSTLLKLIAGIHRPTSGSIATEGRISALLELGAGFHPDLTGRENVYLNGAILGMSRRQLDQTIDEIIDFAGLGEFIDAPVKVYSSGMYVRLGFSVAVHVDPEILVIDEIIAVGDEEFQRRCFDHLYKLRRGGTTIVLVSHSLALMQSMCDRVAWLDHGSLLAEGPAAEVVRQYLGKVNVDESERLAVASGGVARERRGSGEAEVVDVEFLDGRGRVTKVGTTGDAFTIRVKFRSDERLDDPVVGLAIHHESGVHMCGPNSRIGGATLGTIDGDSVVDYSFERLPFLPGTYRVSVSLVDWHLLHVYDYQDQAYELHVQPGSSPEQFGLVDAGGQWKVPTGRSRKRQRAPAKPA